MEFWTPKRLDFLTWYFSVKRFSTTITFSSKIIFPAAKILFSSFQKQIIFFQRFYLLLPKANIISVTYFWKKLNEEIFLKRNNTNWNKCYPTYEMCNYLQKFIMCGSRIGRRLSKYFEIQDRRAHITIWFCHWRAPQSCILN